MKKLYIIFFLTIFLTASHATVWTVTTPGFNFSPATITAELGDTVLFSIAGQHNAVEVSEATWLVNGSTSNGGFALPFGGGTVILTQAKTYYYVCQPHSSMGMKGQIVVNDPTGIPSVNEEDRIFRFQPNPASNITRVHTGIKSGMNNELVVYNMIGKEVMKLKNISNEDLMDISILRKGVYLVSFSSENYSRTTRLVISE